MAMQDGARPFPGAPKKPAAYATPATRPFRRTTNEDGGVDFAVAADSEIGILVGNAYNNNQDSNKQPKPMGNAPESVADLPEGKPSA